MNNENKHGGYRGNGAGFGRPRNVGTGRILKLTCTDREWEQLKTLLPKNNRQKFTSIMESVQYAPPPSQPTADTTKLHTIKLYATQCEWQQMHSLLPRNSRQKFTTILSALKEAASLAAHI